MNKGRRHTSSCTEEQNEGPEPVDGIAQNSPPGAPFPCLFKPEGDSQTSTGFIDPSGFSGEPVPQLLGLLQEPLSDGDQRCKTPGAGPRDVHPGCAGARL